jgi:hypothetical protein
MGIIEDGSPEQEDEEEYEHHRDVDLLQGEESNREMDRLQLLRQKRHYDGTSPTRSRS